MPAAYLTKAILNARGFSDAHLTKSFGDTSTNLTAAINTASEQLRSIVRGRLRNGGAELPETTADEAIVSATAAIFRESMSARLGAAFPLPDGWEPNDKGISAHPDKQMLIDIRAGLQVSFQASPSIADAVKRSSSTAVPQRATDTELAGW